MSDERQSWDQMEGESLLWYKRFTRFRLMTPTRSIAAVFQEEQSERNKEKARTKPTGDWYEIAKQWQWNERAAAWDATQTALLEQGIASERARILLEGYAVMHRRVARLNAEAEQLLAYAQNEDLVWLPDVKAIGNGPDAERVDLIQFNAPLFHEIRAHFADIAAELGERVKKQEIKVRELPKIYVDLTEDEDGVDA